MARMNPFTQFLAQSLVRHQFLSFVRKWDLVEQIVLNTYREQGNLDEDQKIWRKLKSELPREYSRWRETLTPFWKTAFINGEPTESDPFLSLLNFNDVIEFRRNWGAMQTLPAAREAINRLLIEFQTEK